MSEIRCLRSTVRVTFTRVSCEFHDATYRRRCIDGNPQNDSRLTQKVTPTKFTFTGVTLSAISIVQFVLKTRTYLNSFRLRTSDSELQILALPEDLQVRIGVNAVI